MDLRGTMHTVAAVAVLIVIGRCRGAFAHPELVAAAEEGGKEVIFVTRTS